MTNEKGRILVIDDEKNYLLVLGALLEDAGYFVTTMHDPELALTFLDDSEVDVVVTDMKMPKLSGKDVLDYVKKNFPHTPVLIMTAFGSIESAVEVMRYGAFDYITKPFSNDELLLALQNAVELSKTHQKYQILRQSLEERYSAQQIIGRSAAVRELMQMIDRASDAKSSVLLTGESGTGKELVSKALHFNSSRKTASFVAVNCMAFNAANLETELFGSEKESVDGAVAIHRGKFEQANGGTLFLDEIAELSLDIQVKLLRVLQEKCFCRVGGTQEISINIRVVAATDHDILSLVSSGAFREDLYYKLNIVHIHLPPLRERREDIPLLVAHFADSVAKENNIVGKSFGLDTINHLIGYDWPANIRQLQNVVERSMVMVPHSIITIDDLPPEVREEEAQFKSAVDLLPVELNLAETLDRIEAALVRRALVRADMIQVRAADMLGISKSLMQYKLRKYNISGH